MAWVGWEKSQKCTAEKVIIGDHMVSVEEGRHGEVPWHNMGKKAARRTMWMEMEPEDGGLSQHTSSQ